MMKHIRLIMLAIFCCISCNVLLSSNGHVIDEVLVTIYTSDGEAEIVLASDIKPSLDGMPRSLRDIVIERLMIVDSRKFNIAISDDDIERFIADLQKQNGMSRRDMEGLMNQLGYTFEEGKEALKRRNISEQIIDFRIKGDKEFLVTKADVQKHYDKNPEYTKASYTLAQTFIPFSRMPKKEIERHIKKKTIADAVVWDDPFTITQEQLAPEMKFVVDEPRGSIVDRETVLDDELGEGMELTRLVSKKKQERVPLDERYDAILNTLRRERYMKLLDRYYDTLLTDASMRFAYDEDENRVLGN